MFLNAATFAAATKHGFIGEFNGTVIALNSLGLLPGTAGGLHFTNPFHYGVGPIGAGHPIDAGVVFPFVDGDNSPFLTTIVSGVNLGNVVDVFTSEGFVIASDGSSIHAPAILANERLINGGNVPDGGSTAGMLGAALLTLAGLARRTRK